MSDSRYIPPPASGPESLSRPGKGRVVAVHNSPGSPTNVASPLCYDVAVDFGPPVNVRIYRQVPPVNRYPSEYDVYGASPGTKVHISWEGNTPRFTIDWSEAVTTDCTEGLL